MASHYEADDIGNRSYEDDEDCVEISVGHLTVFNVATKIENATNKKVTGDGAELLTDMDTVEQKTFQSSFNCGISSICKRWCNRSKSETSCCAVQRIGVRNSSVLRFVMIAF